MSTEMFLNIFELECLLQNYQTPDMGKIHMLLKKLWTKDMNQLWPNVAFDTAKKYPVHYNLPTITVTRNEQQEGIFRIFQRLDHLIQTFYKNHEKYLLETCQFENFGTIMSPLAWTWTHHTIINIYTYNKWYIDEVKTTDPNLYKDTLELESTTVKILFEPRLYLDRRNLIVDGYWTHLDTFNYSGNKTTAKIALIGLWLASAKKYIHKPAILLACNEYGTYGPWINDYLNHVAKCTSPAKTFWQKVCLI